MEASFFKISCNCSIEDSFEEAIMALSVTNEPITYFETDQAFFYLVNGTAKLNVDCNLKTISTYQSGVIADKLFSKYMYTTIDTKTWLMKRD